MNVTIQSSSGEKCRETINTIRNKYGDIGSPWRRPPAGGGGQRYHMVSHLKENVVLDTHLIIHPIHPLQKPILLINLSKKNPLNAIICFSHVKLQCHHTPTLFILAFHMMKNLKRNTLSVIKRPGRQALWSALINPTSTNLSHFAIIFDTILYTHCTILSEEIRKPSLGHLFSILRQH